MVLGSTRERSFAGADEGQQDLPPRARLEDWRVERGAVHWEGGADLAGGFPGFAARGGRLAGVQFRLTDHFVLVDDGRPHGFGLPLSCLLGADLFVSPRAERPEPSLRLRYRDGGEIRTFLVRFRGSLLGPRGGRRAEQVLAALQAIGLAAAGEPLPAAPELAVSWDEAARFEGENVIWSGQASALVAVGGALAACDVWLTTRSVIWGSSAGSGILRLPLEAVVDAVPADLADRTATPAVYVAAADDQGGRHDLPFVFDRHSPAPRNVRERGAFVVGLRSRGIPLGTAPPLPQPWRDGDIPQEPLPPVTSLVPADGADLGRQGTRPSVRRPVPTGRFRPRPLPPEVAQAPGRWERAMAEWTGHPNWPEPELPDDRPDTQPPMPGRLLPRLDAPSADTADRGEAGRRPDRGVLVPWPGTPRPGHVTADFDHGGGRSMPATGVDVSAGAGGTARAAEAAPSATPAPNPAPSATPAPNPAAGGDPAPSAAPPSGGSWPVPTGYPGPVAIDGPPGFEEEAGRAEEDLAAGVAESSAAAGPTDVGGNLRLPDEVDVGQAPESVREAGDPADAPRAVLRRYEASLLRAITDALRAIEGHSAWDAGAVTPAPTPGERAAAFGALDALVAAGQLSTERAAVHRSLLVAAGEAGPRLRSLLELRAAGYLGDDDLDRKRRQIVAPLAELLAR